MIRLKFRYTAHFFAPLIGLVLLAGCMSSTPHQSSQLSNEEAYIDLKLSFSIVVPVTWKRLRTPVSSPTYRPNLVQWEIAGPTRVRNHLQILRTSIKPNTAALAHYLSAPEESVSALAQTFEYSFGPAIKLEKTLPGQQNIYVATSNNGHTYILSFQINQSDYARLEPVISNVIKSFNTLQ